MLDARTCLSIALTVLTVLVFGSLRTCAQSTVPTSNDSAATFRSGAIGPPPGDLTRRAAEHPLQPVIRWAHSGLEALREVEGYTCTLVKRERIDGVLRPHERLELKVRHRPFSVYACYPRREGPPWQEVIYVEGQNNGMMWAHSDRYKFMGTASIYPDGRRALQESRYPLTQVGILNLVERLVEHAERDARYAECDLKIDRDAKIDGRPCLCIAVTHPTPRKQFRFYHARVYIDSELNVPVRYESYHWPRSSEEGPLLLEEYTYLNYRFDATLTDRDFNIANPAYRFPEPDKDSDVELATGAAGQTSPSERP